MAMVERVLARVLLHARVAAVEGEVGRVESHGLVVRRTILRGCVDGFLSTTHDHGRGEVSRRDKESYSTCTVQYTV
jgi:hypothetical protein